MLVTFCLCFLSFLIFFFKQKTAYEMRISDWSSDVCSSDLRHRLLDAINIALESTAPDARARMIQLEVKHAAAQQVGFGVPGEIARALIPLSRSEERRVGKECVRTVRSRWSPEQ